MRSWNWLSFTNDMHRHYVSEWESPQYSEKLVTWLLLTILNGRASFAHIFFRCKRSLLSHFEAPGCYIFFCEGGSHSIEEGCLLWRVSCDVCDPGFIGGLGCGRISHVRENSWSFLLLFAIILIVYECRHLDIRRHEYPKGSNKHINARF